jgi:hypothetical protein
METDRKVRRWKLTEKVLGNGNGKKGEGREADRKVWGWRLRGKVWG